MTDTHADDDFGPWYAILCDKYGFCYDTVEDALEDEDDVEIKVVKGSAAPQGENDHLKLPGHHLSDDVLYEVDGFTLDEENIEMLWARAQRVADALNQHESRLRKEAAQS